jgi:hypothetical protein
MRLFCFACHDLSHPIHSTWMKCYCQTDSHCPMQHKCVPSLSFPEFKVCKADMSDKPDSLTSVVVSAMRAMAAGK